MLDPQDQEAYYLRSASEKARIINDMQYGTDSALLPLYTLIKNAPVYTQITNMNLSFILPLCVDYFCW